MLDVVICVSTNLFRVYLIYKFIQIFVEDQKQGKIKEAAAYTAFFLVNTGLYLLLHMAWVNLLCNLLGMGFLVSLYTKSWKKIFFVAGSVCLINAGCDIFSVLVFSGYEEGTPINQLCSLPMVFLVFICELITERIMKVRRNKIDEVQSLPLMLVPLCSIGMILFILYCNNISDWEIVGISIGLMVINFLVFYLYNLLLKAFSEKCENEVLKQKIEIYTNQIDTILQSEKEVRALRHDMKHHMNEIMLLAEKNETAEIQEYIDSMAEFIGNANEIVSSGNTEIDSVLNYMLQKAKREGMEVHTKVQLPEAVIHSFDIVVVLGNLLENAMEAARRTEEKYLGVIIQLKQGILKVEIENSYIGSLKNDLQTTKQNKKEHGIGLENVRRVVEKNNGTMEIVPRNGRFYVKLILYLSEKT